LLGLALIQENSGVVKPALAAKRLGHHYMNAIA